MIQDIYPSRLYNEFHKYEMADNDICIFYDAEGRLLIKEENGRISFTHGSDARGRQSIFLFSVDDSRFFLAPDGSMFQKDGYAYKTEWLLSTR